MFFLLAKNIEVLPDNASDDNKLKALLRDVEVLKKIARNVCRVIVKHEKIKHEDGKGFFSLSDWRALLDKTDKEQFVKERKALERGRTFVLAYNTPMGVEVSEGMLRCIQNGYEAISKCEIDMKGIYEMNIYRLLIVRWEAKILAYKKNIERVNKIIYKEN